MNIGDRFGRLTVIAWAGYKPRSDGRNRSAWICRCDCCVEKPILARNLLSGKTQSCGCLIKERIQAGLNFKHGEAVVRHNTKEYRIWRNMISRTTDSNSRDFERYGGRGIRVCERWLQSYSNFISDMGRCPEGRSLERKNNDGPYSVENCTWATSFVQANNTSRNRWITVKGIRRTVAQWARLAGVSANTIYPRLKRGFTGLEAVCGSNW